MGESFSKTKANNDVYGFIDVIFSWSIDHIVNEDLFKHKVEKINQNFQSIVHYLGSYEYPLLEETRAQLCSGLEIIDQAPYAEVIGLKKAKPKENKLYNLEIDSWKNRSFHNGEPHKPLPGDVLVLADYKPETVRDLQRFGKFWSFVSVVWTTESESVGDSMSGNLQVKAAKDIDPEELRHRTLFLVFLTNVNPNRRIWDAIRKPGNLKLVKQILCIRDEVGNQVEDCCSSDSIIDCLRDDYSYKRLLSELNESQHKAICACLSGLNCSHNSPIKLIWGPPGTGKTKTLVTLLFALLKMKYRVLVCAPTNVAIKEVASRVLAIIKESHSSDLFCSMGELLLFGNNERLNVDEDIEDIYLDYRVQQLIKCFSPNGWRSCLQSMIDLLENCVSLYHGFVEEELKREKKPKSFLEFLRERFCSAALPVKSCISTLCTHVALCHLLEHNYLKLMHLDKELQSLQDLLFQDNLLSEGLLRLFSCLKLPDMISTLRTVIDSLDRIVLPKSFNKDFIRNFCFQTSSMLFCTTSGSYKLRSSDIKPLNILVIDEAAQVKECESLISLSLPEINNVILVGDECQLPSMVRSNVSYEAGFGRSLFQRLSALGHPKLLLNMQHRMHPKISSFPNSYFYSNKIQDAPNVERSGYGKQYLPGPMFGPYSFINIVEGKERFDDFGRSYQNMAEVAVVMTILKELHKAWITSKEKLSIGIVSPYAGQVVAVQKKLGKMYESHDGFNVSVKSIDGFQGGECNVIILSTVRTNRRASLEFISSPQRTNVALTRARHCLWILGNEMALTHNENVWKAVVLDAKNRKCFFDADEDKEMKKAILDARKESEQIEDLLDTNGVLFKGALWKVHFNDKFLRSIKRLRLDRTKNMVIDLLHRLSKGWRPQPQFSGEISCENSSQILKQFKVERFYLICSIEIIKAATYFQVLKIWDILPLEEVPKLATRLDNNLFRKYTDKYINRCKEKGSNGNVEFPLSWPLSENIQKFRSADNNENERDVNANEDSSQAKNSKFEESLLLMKYCSISRNYILYGHESLEVKLPFEVTSEQRKIILFPQSTFVLGRSGTGKTTVLISKLLQNEKLHHMAVEEVYASTNYANVEESIGIIDGAEKPVLRQLFVTLNAGLCQKVQYHVSLLRRSLSKGGTLAESGSVLEDIGDTDSSTQFMSIPNSLYPLVITFRKFLLMLDRTLGNSYFERFFYLKGQDLGSRLVAFETTMTMKEVNFERFDSLYWPHFNSQLSKPLDSYQVFTEIMSHIKGCTKVCDQGKLTLEDYCTLSEGTTSNLSQKTRGIIYDIFLNYEKMKMDNGEFDLGDVVIDLHRRLRTQRYNGDEMHYVYIDEVQDLTMAQISLFKYVCKNIKEGFVFCGDTAQTIGRGIDFRFKDVRSLFYKKFVLESDSWNDGKRKEKGQISDIFVLSQNFCTNAEVLKLSQSIIDLLFHFFPLSIDKLKVETSLVHVEAPIVIAASINRRNSIFSIFGESGDKGENTWNFGREQVILVRDDAVRKEIMHIVGKQAHVLTILECKGLEFQDVLLCNFFASSPLKRRWGIIYEYMKEKGMLDSRTHINFRRSSDDSKHNVLCSELKQLYVALTLTRRRLFIYEEEGAEEFCTPMFDYWKRKNLVQFQ